MVNNLKGKDKFNKSEAKIIRKLLDLKVESSRTKQKIVRSGLRTMDFYITDFDKTFSGFKKGDFELLVRRGEIKII